jgi:crotonobetainyl-CoA:carnitine CoA-transferase CaiB-like acyl-CoA transferase
MEELAIGPTGPLSGLRVVEWGEHVSAPYAARMLADLGADVVKVERPEGDSSRRHGPFAGPPDPEASGLFHALNFNKRGVVLDTSSRDGLTQLDRLVAEADVFITNADLEERRASGLDGPALLARHPGLVAVAVTPWGDDGPYAGAPGCSLTASAIGGASWAIGLPGRAPLTLPFDLADYEAGANAAAATLAAVLLRRRGGPGQTIDIAVAEVIASFVAINARIYVPYGKPWQRSGRRASESGGAYPYTLLPCRDGYVALIGRSARDWQTILRALGASDWADDERFADPLRVARECPDEADARLSSLFASRTREELFALAREHGFALAPVRSIPEVLQEPQFSERGLFVDGVDAGGRPLTPPGAPYRLSGFAAGGPVRPAPRLGEHAAELLEAPELQSIASRGDR